MANTALPAENQQIEPPAENYKRLNIGFGVMASRKIVFISYQAVLKAAIHFRITSCTL